MASTAGLNSLAHSLTFGINLAVFTNLVQYMYMHSKPQRRGPLYCVIAATVLVMADLGRHLINDANNWFLSEAVTGNRLHFDLSDCTYTVGKISGSPQCPDIGKGPFNVSEENALGIDMSMYNEDGSLSVYGWLFTIFGTWSGFALLFIGIMWHSDLVRKLRRQFRLLRRTDRDQQVTEAFLTPESRAVDLEAESVNAGFLTPFSEPGSPAATLNQQA